MVPKLKPTETLQSWEKIAPGSFITKYSYLNTLPCHSTKQTCGKIPTLWNIQIVSHNFKPIWQLNHSNFKGGFH